MMKVRKRTQSARRSSPLASLLKLVSQFERNSLRNVTDMRRIVERFSSALREEKSASRTSARKRSTSNRARATGRKGAKRESVAEVTHMFGT